MRRTSILAVAVLAVVLTVSPTLGGGEPVELPDGETLMVMHPGVDGVEGPVPIRGNRAAPAYPAAAMGLGSDALVTVAVLVRDDGSVAHAEVMAADHPGLGFEEHALTAIRQWAYVPARSGNDPVTSYHLVRLRFREPISAPVVPAEFGAGMGAAEFGAGMGAADIGIRGGLAGVSTTSVLVPPGTIPTNSTASTGTIGPWLRPTPVPYKPCGLGQLCSQGRPLVRRVYYGGYVPAEREPIPDRMPTQRPAQRAPASPNNTRE